jgi:hypothetical protein
MLIDDASLVRLASDPVSASAFGETVILDPASSMYYRLTGVGERVCELLAEPRPVRFLYATLLDEHYVAPDVLLHDLRALLG